MVHIYLAESVSETELDFADAPVINGYFGDLSKLEKFIAPPCVDMNDQIFRDWIKRYKTSEQPRNAANAYFDSAVISTQHDIRLEVAVDGCRRDRQDPRSRVHNGGSLRPGIAG